ncbi:MAG: radical SAM protein [Planctomycetota bacterium]
MSAAGGKEFRDAPLYVVWELTLACNLRCRHCGSSAGASRHRELDAGEALTLAGDLATLGCERVTLMGGEPLLRPDWPAIAMRLAGGGAIPEMVSNGMTLDGPTARRIAESGVQSVTVSIDGTERVHDDLRRHSGSFRRALESLAHLDASGLPAGVVTQVNRNNLGDLEDLYRALLETPARAWQIQLAEPLGRCLEDGGLMIAQGDLPAVERFILGVAREGRLPIYAADNIGYMGKNEPLLRSGAPEGIPCWAGCRAGFDVLGLTSDGRVRGCLSLPEAFNEGSVRDRPIADIWRNPESFSYNRGPSRHGPAGACAECPFGRLCRGGCTSLAFTTTGVVGNNPYCLRRIEEGWS